MTPQKTRTYLLTGVTGFVGKVVLHEMLRRKVELGVAGVVVVIRAKGSRSATERFRDEVAASACFAGFAPDWTRQVSVLDGDLTAPGFGSAPDQRALLTSVTHVIHAAASVSFTLPGAVAARANITASLNLLDATRGCAHLERFIYVSTAYVSPHHDGPIPEALVALPAPADTLLATITRGTEKDADVLARTGHPNTYTLTKTIAEHLLAERRGSVPLSIVRPSIITASRERPMPGWIDSSSGFGAFVTLIGLGHLRAVIGRAEARLDLIPVDDVARCVLDESLGTSDGVTVRHAVAGAARAATVHECWEVIERYFRLRPVDRMPVRRYLGPRDASYVLADLLHHRLPMALASVRSAGRRGQVRRLASRLAYLNEVFPYFTTRTFDFQTSVPLPAHFDSQRLVATVCRGVSRHLFKQNDEEWVLAGRAHVGQGNDLRWVLRQPAGNAFVRLSIWLATKVLRRVADSVTVDVPSFERARAAVPDEAAIALVPTHRSFLDFILCSYLAFARPDLGIRIPHIAAAVEFGRLPVLGHLLRTVHAFYVERGTGRENRHLARRVHELLDAGEVIEFFVEGERSRSRAFLPPKRGLLRCLQSSGRRCALFPIALTYDRIPEERVFARELAGLPKARLRLGPLFRWLVDVWRGQVQLGRIHIACGAPVFLDATSDLQQVGEAIIAQLRGATAVSSYHIEGYLAHYADGELDAAALRGQIVAAGGRVLESSLRVSPDLDRAIAHTLGEHFAHLR